MRGTTLSLCLSLVLGCDEGNANKTSTNKPVGVGSARVAGVYPEKFECASVAPPEALSTVLGAPTRAIETKAGARGLPRPCSYEVATTTPEMWTFDIDCRDNYKKTADALFEQYRQINAERIAGYNAISDAGVKAPNDAGTVYTAPGNASEVAVGAKGLDHNDQGLIFVDDDAPCYVRVIGSDAPRRLALAKTVAKNLTFANAPMTPRAMP
jgi:hypothetical protein